MTRASLPHTGHASSMSSATPAAFLSAISITTTSASCFSAMPRATVAPTLPAPPTTVTLRFMSISRGETLDQLHVLDDGVRERRRFQLDGVLHLPREVVGHLLLRDRPLERLLDERPCLGPAQIIQHHDARENDRPRVDDV